METAPVRLVINHALWQQVTSHVQYCLPEEGCGLLGGRLAADGAGLVTLVLPVENILHSPTRFRMEPSAQLHAFYALEERSLELLAIFHSHPRGPERPSVTDLVEFAYPGVLSLILYHPGHFDPGQSSRAWLGRAFRIDGLYNPNAAVSEVPLAVEIPM